MLIREEEDLDPIKTQIFDAVVGFDEEQTLKAKRIQSKRLLHVRRAIEQRHEEMELSPYLDNESWFEE